MPAVQEPALWWPCLRSLGKCLARGCRWRIWEGGFWWMREASGGQVSALFLTGPATLVLPGERTG